MINLDEVCDCCGGYGVQSLLQLSGNKCFQITDGKEIDGEFCLKDLAYPVDGHNCINLNATLNGESLTLFDNQLDTHTPGEPLVAGQLYARGLLLRITYPTTDINGDDILYATKSVKLVIEDSYFNESELPLFDFFTIFTNPKSNDANQLINKIKVYNPNSLYNIRVSALILFGEAQ